MRRRMALKMAEQSRYQDVKLMHSGALAAGPSSAPQPGASSAAPNAAAAAGPALACHIAHPAGARWSCRAAIRDAHIRAAANLHRNALHLLRRRLLQPLSGGRGPLRAEQLAVSGGLGQARAAQRQERSSSATTLDTRRELGTRRGQLPAARHSHGTLPSLIAFSYLFCCAVFMASLMPLKT